MYVLQRPIRMPLDPTLLSVWRTQIAEVTNPHTQHQLVQQEQELLPRFVAYYHKLQHLPRHLRRLLQRRCQNDVIVGGLDNDQLNGGLGNDIMVGSEGNDTLLGNDGNDRLFGEVGDDRLFGGAGDDLLNGGLDTDYCDGQTGGGDSASACEKTLNIP